MKITATRFWYNSEALASDLVNKSWWYNIIFDYKMKHSMFVFNEFYYILFVY